MSDAKKPFAFSQFVPGFDFLQNLAGGNAASGMSSLSNWVAPTLSVEEVDKRIQELKTVQFWLEQNAHALKATIQALEVQRMTLSTLRSMNVQMEDLAKTFAQPAAAPAPEPEPKEAREADAPAKPSPRPAPAEAGVADPVQWWGALTQQFQQIASAALQDASQLKMPVALAAVPKAGVAKASPARPAGKASGKTAAAKTSAARKRSPRR